MKSQELCKNIVHSIPVSFTKYHRSPCSPQKKHTTYNINRIDDQPLTQNNPQHAFLARNLPHSRRRLAPKARANARIASRVAKLRATLANLKEKIEIRQQIVNLAETNGRYCITCGPRPTKPYCSMTCPLLKAARGWQPIRVGDRA